MKSRSIVALSSRRRPGRRGYGLDAGATKKATANSITVWLQVDAQSGWPESSPPATKQFQAGASRLERSTSSTRTGATTCRSSTPRSPAATGPT